jgi:DNA repair exonuclease SbcCD ATPase subunit
MSAMWFKSVEVSRFRQFRATVKVRGLTPGLNVIAGDNEEGKSTLLQAIRAALFDKYTGSVADAYRPYGQSVSPRVAVVFEIDAVEYRFDKVFSRKKDGQATLVSSDGRRWEGPQAEEFVAGVLGFAYAPRGASRPEHQGLAGLLWIDQAHAFEAVTLSDQSRRQLHAVFDTEMSEMLGGEHGEVLHRRIGELRGAYFDKRNKPRGEYRQLQDKQTRLAERLERARFDLRDYEGKTDQLEKRQTVLRGYLNERALDKARAKLREVEARYQQVQVLAKQVEAGRQKLSLSEAEQTAVRMAWEARAKLVQEQQQAQAAVIEVQALLAERETAVEPARKAVDELKTRLAAEKEDRAVHEARLRRAHEAEQLARLTAEKEELEARFKEARAAEAARRRSRLQRDAISVTAGSLDALRRVEHDRTLAEVRLHTAATRLDHRLQPSAPVRLAGEPMQGEGTVLVTETSVLEVDGVGSFTIHPGGEDLETLHEQLKEHRRTLRQQLAGLDVESIGAAETALKTRQALDTEAMAHKARLSGIAPQGLGEIEERLASLDSQRQALLARVGEGGEGRGDDPAALERRLGEFSASIAAREVELAEQQRLFSGRREALVEAGAAARSAQNHAQALEQALHTARKGAADDKLAAALADADGVVEFGRQQLAALQRALEAEKPDSVALEVDRCEQAFDQVKCDIARLEKEANDLTVELNALGQRGLAEELAQAEVEYAALERELNHIEAQARAVDLLYRTLDASLRSAKEALARPVIARLVPYLRQLIPGAEPSISEDMVLTGIHRDSTAELFADLSIGTREQLAVLVRLAYADLLSEQGMPVTVILDDALVNSDDERRERMKSILYQAAQRYQVLVLTCHEREYCDAGGTFIRLADCKEREGLSGYQEL